MHIFSDFKRSKYVKMEIWTHNGSVWSRWKDDDDECSWLDLQGLDEIFKIWTNPLGSWACTHENVLEENQDKYHLGGIFGPQKKRRKRCKTMF